MIREAKAVATPRGWLVDVLPFPKELLKEVSSWLRSERSRAELKKLAEGLARKESIKTAKSDMHNC
ncbi:MAG: hypothetical protein ACRD5H_08640 [Nitrososphaerales archaeon]